MSNLLNARVVCGWALGVAAALAACQGPAEPAEETVPGRAPHAFPMVEDNLSHDTLLVQVTFDLGDGTFIMVAGNVEETREGLRLYRYRLGPQGDPRMLAVSSPAYDSWTMLPTFFPLDTMRPADAAWLLANFGEKESWGQKLILLDSDFVDMGFMDAAMPERSQDGDTLRLRRRNVAPYMRYSEHGDTAVWRFACDSVYLYDDQAGGFDQVVAARRLRFTFHRDEGLVLWLDGQKRPVKVPS